MDVVAPCRALVPHDSDAVSDAGMALEPEDWNAVANFSAEEPDLCVSALEVRRAAVFADGEHYYEHIRAFKVPAEFSGFAVDQKFGYLAGSLQTLSEASGSEFARVYGCLEEQTLRLQEVVSCIQHTDESMASDDATDQRLSALEDVVEVELAAFTSKVQASEVSVVQLNKKLDISLAKTDILQQQISSLGNRLSSLEGAFSSFTVETNRSISALISRFDAMQATCSDPANDQVRLLRSALSRVDQTLQRHSAILEQTDLVKAHGLLAADVADLRTHILSLQPALQSFPSAPVARSVAHQLSTPPSSSGCHSSDFPESQPQILQPRPSLPLPCHPPVAPVTRTTEHPPQSAPSFVPTSTALPPNTAAVPSQSHIPFFPPLPGAPSVESVRIAPVQASSAAEPFPGWQNLQMQQDLRKLVPQPQFKGERAKWRDFVSEWEVWWKVAAYPPQYKAFAFISCLPPDEQEICRVRLTKFGHGYDRLFEDLSRRYSVDDSLLLRKQWHDCRCAGEDLSSFLKWHNHWTLLRERLSEVSESEAKSCFLSALPDRLRTIVLKKDETTSGKAVLSDLETHLRTKIETEEKRRALQNQISDSVSAVSAKSNAPSSQSLPKVEVQAVQDRSFQHVRNNRWPARGGAAGRWGSQTSNQRRGPSPKPFHRNFQCFYCKATGHTQLFCPKRKADGVSLPSKSKSDRFCAFCKKSGHVEAYCFAKRRHDSSTTPSFVPAQRSSSATTGRRRSA